MITDVQYVIENGILISYSSDGNPENVTFDAIKEYVSEDDVEGGIAYIINDDQILFSVMVAGGQDGFLFIWNCKEHKIVHASNAPFCVAANMYNDTIFYLCEVSYYAMPVHYEVFRIHGGTIDVNDHGHQVFCREPRKIISRQTSDSLDICFDNQSLIVMCGNNKYVFVDNIFDPQIEIPQAGYEHLYKALETVQEKSLHGDMSDFRMIEDMLL